MISISYSFETKKGSALAADCFVLDQSPMKIVYDYRG
jgi:hypothetical protein